MNATSKWIPAVTAQAERLWLSGKSAGEVAKAIGLGFTRNAVIGKMMRLGHVRDESVRHINKARAARSRIAAPHAWAHRGRAPLGSVPLTIILTGPVEASQPSRLIDTTAGCRWPVEGEGFDTLFCCATIARGRYCAGHAAVAFQPDKPSRARDLARFRPWA